MDYSDFFSWVFGAVATTASMLIVWVMRQFDGKLKRTEGKVDTLQNEIYRDYATKADLNLVQQNILSEMKIGFSETRQDIRDLSNKLEHKQDKK